MKISGLVITYNEEKNIEACIKSLFKVCEDVVVIDSMSSDRTVDIAYRLGAKVYKQKFLGDGPQRSFGLKYCKNDWILNLDADERLELNTIEKIKILDLDNTHLECYEFKRKNYLHKNWIKVAGWYPDYVRRLFNKKKTDFSPVSTHTKITSKKFIRLDNNILHYSFDDYNNMIDIMNKYSSWQANEYYVSNRKVSFLSAVLHGWFSFFKSYVIKRGFLAGVEGFNISLLNGLGSYFKYMKLYEYNKLQK
jgi:glycosyltransferase involved in cell wall biosynthesis